MTVNGTLGCAPPQNAVEITLDNGVVLARGDADESGGFGDPLLLPDGISPGQHWLARICANGGEPVFGFFTVVLPATGADSAPIVIVGLALVTAGVALRLLGSADERVVTSYPRCTPPS